MTFRDEKATVSHLPCFSGDGYGYGGSVVLTIGGTSLLLGEGELAAELAKEIAGRWNAPAVQMRTNATRPDADRVALDILNKIEETPVDWPWVRRKAHAQVLIIDALNAASAAVPSQDRT